MSDRDAPHDTDPAIADTAHSEPGSATEVARPRRSQRSVQAGDQLGRYTLEEQVGEGGMATVYRARDRDLRREVAVKVLFPHLARRPEVVQRFHREARAAAGLEHANILRIYDVGPGEPDSDDPPHIVMELIRGRSLLGELEQRGPMLAEIVACIGALLADALAAAHAKGIIHRDIKPANVLVAPNGRLLLADFGVARLETEESSLVTKTGALLGTPAYMSPEQAGGDTATAKSDLYSLGATLYQLATGSLPYSGSPARVLASIATGAMQPAVRRRPAVGPDLSRLIDTMMATDAEKRPASAAVLATELRAIAAAGGLGEPTDELAAYFADQDAFLRTRTSTVVTALVSAAKTALDASRLPRAMALADRASALAPDDPAVTALVQTVTEGGRSSNRKRVIGFAAIGVLVAGGATAAGVTLLGDASAPAIADATVATIDAPTPDAAIVVVAIADAMAPVPVLGDAAVVDAGRVRDAGTLARVDARPAVIADAAVAAIAPPIDAAVALPPPIDAPNVSVAELGRLTVENDTWCDLLIDGVPQGRVTRKKVVTVPVGRRLVACAQPGIVGMAWSQEVEVTAERMATARGSMLADVEITIAVNGPKVQIERIHYLKGIRAKIKPGRYRAVVEGGAAGYLTIPRVPACTVREVGNSLVCDP